MSTETFHSQSPALRTRRERPGGRASDYERL